MTERIELQERYTRAIDSTHLELTEERGALDYVVAAGWVRDGLGTMLFRLMTEFDSVRGEHRQAWDNLREADANAKRELIAGTADCVAADAVAPSRREEVMRAAQSRIDAARAAVASAEAAALTAKALILVRLKTLPEARRALAVFALGLATRTRFMRPNNEVLVIAGKAMSAWLDPLCNVCQGRSFSGGYTSPVMLCGACNATGRRKAHLGSDYDSHEFGKALLVQMDRKTERVSRVMTKYLRKHGPNRKAPPGAVLDLEARLQGLRSVEAGRD